MKIDSQGRDSKEIRARLFVIDDEPSIRSAISRFLSRRGWDVEEAADGREALQTLQHSEPGYYDVVLSDLRMPNCSGIELYRGLVSSRPDLVRRLVFSSGDVASEDASTFLASSARPVIEKPFELAHLEEVFQTVVDDARSANVQ